jgi:hypothetical protein
MNTSGIPSTWIHLVFLVHEYIRYFFCWPLLFEVWQRVVCIVVIRYIVDHYCLRFDRGVVCIVVIRYIVDHYCLTESGLYCCDSLYCWPLLFEVWQRVVCIVVIRYIVDHYCLRFDREWFVLWWLVILLTTTVWGLTESGLYCGDWLYCWPLLFEVWQRVVCIVVIRYIVDHYCLRFDREWFVLWWLVILLTTTVWGLPEEWCVLLWLVILQTITVRSTREVICALMVGYITDHSSLKFTREVVCNIVDY